ncbi:MAG: response regulator transcription factor [Stenotrophobium sp.]
MRILVVEDDRPIALALQHGLRKAGHAVDLVHDGLAAEQAALGGDWELILMDLGLPGQDGYSVLTKLRARSAQVPVILLTARDELGQRVRGLDLGADDYITKPFEMDELLARIRAVTRRSTAATGGDISLGRLRLDPVERRFYMDGEALEFTPREFGVLELLLLRRGRVVSKAQILEHLCDWNDELSESAIELYIHRIRRKLEISGLQLQTVRGFGYLLKLDDEAAG